MTLPATLSSGSSFLSCFLHTMESGGVLFASHCFFQTILASKTSPNFISLSNCTVPPYTHSMAVIFHPYFPFIGDFVKTFQGSEVLPHLQANRATATVSSMLAEDERFLGQKPRTITNSKSRSQSDSICSHWFLKSQFPKCVLERASDTCTQWAER